MSTDDDLSLVTQSTEALLMELKRRHVSMIFLGMTVREDNTEDTNVAYKGSDMLMRALHTQLGKDIEDAIAELKKQVLPGHDNKECENGEKAE